MGRISDERAIWLSRQVLPHEPALRAWLKSKRQSAHDIDDTVQETYAILAAMQSVDHIVNPRAYCFSTAHSIIMRQHRRARIVQLSAIEDLANFDPPSEDAGPERLLAGRQELLRLAAALAALPSRARTAFILRKVNGLSQCETALRMGISESTVEKHMGKGLRLLATMLGNGGKLAPKTSGECEAVPQTRQGIRRRRPDRP